MRANYDVVLVDTPPVGLITDARMLGKQADGVIVVVRSGQTAREQAETAMRRLVEDGTRIMGAVLNDWTPDRAFNAYGSNYYGKNQPSAKRA
jgi:Mrp family chromosome partitioning ATPase